MRDCARHCARGASCSACESGASTTALCAYVQCCCCRCRRAQIGWRRSKTPRSGSCKRAQSSLSLVLVTRAARRVILCTLAGARLPIALLAPPAPAAPRFELYAAVGPAVRPPPTELRAGATLNIASLALVRNGGGARLAPLAAVAWGAHLLGSFWRRKQARENRHQNKSRRSSRVACLPLGWLELLCSSSAAAAAAAPTASSSGARCAIKKICDKIGATPCDRPPRRWPLRRDGGGRRAKRSGELARLAPS